VKSSHPTAMDVARIAGVSQSAVSRAFTGASVAPETRERIFAAARQIGYRPNAIARTLSTRRSRMVGLVVGRLANAFYAQVVERLSLALQRDGYHVLMFINEAPDADELLADILQYQVDAIVMASTTLSSTLAQACARSGIPVVLFNRVAQLNAFGTPVASSVTTDNVAGGRRVGELLVAAGHRRVAFLAGLENASTSREREAGLLDALEQAGLSLHARMVGNYDFDGACRAVQDLFAGDGPKPDAVFAANDHMAIAAMETLRHRLGLAVPGDVSVVGFDDIPQAAWPSFDLTTVAQDVDRMVEATRSLVMEQMKGEHRPRHIGVAGRLIERGSCAQRSEPGGKVV
jgi:DNA-binding LacI/PurR family transcriptional regulator